MSTIQLHPEYASRNIGLSGQNKSDATKNQNSNEKNSTERAADQPKLSFLLDNPMFSFSKKEQEKEESSLLVGIFNDVFKNIPKLLTGSILTDVVKSLYKNADLTWQEVIYKNLLDSSPSRIFNDVVNSLMVRFLNGNHSFFKLFRLPYIAPELASQITSPVMVTLMRSLTAKSNVNAKSARNNISEEQGVILDEINNGKRWFFNMVDALSGDTMDKLKPGIDKILGAIGIHAGKLQVDKEGKKIYERDKNGKVKKSKDGKPKLLYTNQQVNKGLLGSVVAGSYLGSFLLPKHTAAFGFEKAKNLPRMLFSTLFTTLCRLNTTMLHNAVGMHRQAGANFDFCFRTSLVEKLLVPFTQYFSDALGSFLAGKVPINGASLAMTLRLITEIPATFLSNGLINIAKKDRVDDEWTYLAHKLWKPVVDVTETAFKPLFATVCKSYGYTLGIYDPRIPNMYGKDIRTEETKAKENLPEAIKEKYKDANLFTDLLLFGKKILQIPTDLVKLKNEVVVHAGEVEDHIQKTVNKRNSNIDLRLAAEKALETVGVDSFRPKTDDPDTNRAILKTISDSNKEDITTNLEALLSKGSTEKFEFDDKVKKHQEALEMAA